MKRSQFWKTRVCSIENMKSREGERRRRNEEKDLLLEGRALVLPPSPFCFPIVEISQLLGDGRIHKFPREGGSGNWIGSCRLQKREFYSTKGKLLRCGQCFLLLRTQRRCAVGLAFAAWKGVFFFFLICLRELVAVGQKL